MRPSFPARLKTALIVFLLAGCGPSVVPVARDADPFRTGQSPPAGCAVGLSGPTLHQGEAIYYAEADAIQNLAQGTSGMDVHVESTQVDQGGAAGHFRQVIRQHVRGRLLGVRVVRLWRDARGEGFARQQAVIYAVACDEKGAALYGADRRFPLLADSATRPCALGVAGPTLLSDQKEVAFEDARARLAELLAADVEAILVDYDLKNQEVWQSIRSPEAVRARVESDARLDGYILDESGDGPLGLKGVAYALACL